MEEWEGRPLVRMSVIERYPAGASRHITNGYLLGINLATGAVATSYPSPKSYIVAVGRDAGEMHCAVAHVDAYPGACAVTAEGQPLACLPIEIYGMMADMSAGELLQQSAEIDRACAGLGHVNSGEPVVNKLLSLFVSLHRVEFME